MAQLWQQVRILDPIALTERVGDILVVDELVQPVTAATELPPELAISSGQHLICAPGLVDLYSHSGSPGHEERETLAALLAAARAGGFVRIDILPDTLPALDRLSSIISLDRHYQQVAAQMVNCPQLGYWAALTQDVAGQSMTELVELATIEICGWADGRAIANPALIYNLLTYLKPYHRPIALYACDQQLRSDGLARAGVAALKSGLPLDPACSETAALAATLEIVAEIGTPVHLMRISTRRGVELIAAAKQRGVPVTASTTWLHLIANTSDLASYDPNLKLDPPLGTATDQIALIEGIKSGVLDTIAIDRYPYNYEEKTVAFGEAPPGAIGLELALPLLWQNLVATGRLSALELWQALSVNPSRCLDRPSPDPFILFEPDRTWQVSIANLHSAHNTSWLGREIRGQVYQGSDT